MRRTSRVYLRNRPEIVASRPAESGMAPAMFFFSNNLGCLPSIVISVVLSAILFLILGIL